MPTTFDLPAATFAYLELAAGGVGQLDDAREACRELTQLAGGGGQAELGGGGDRG